MPRIWRKRIELDKYHRDEDGYIRGDRPCTKILVHYQFTPKYRKDISVYPGLLKALGLCIQDICDYNNWYIDSLAIETDHVHLCVQLPPTVTVSDGARIIKCNSSRMIREAYPELRKDLNKSSFWGKHFFAKTVGDVDFERTKRYIENQGIYRYSAPLCGGRKPTRL